MNKNNNLTRFDTGGTHESSPLGGIPLGNNSSVEQNETKQDNFIYSNRIFLDENVVSQYNLPKSLVGKSVADATKYIDNKFKGRNDKISQSTKDSMLSKIAEAQESMKPQESEMGQQITPENMNIPNQMAFGGFSDSVIGQGFSEEATGEEQNKAIAAGIGTVATGLDLGNLAFGKPAQNTDGLAPSAEINKGGMIAGSALKGASAGAALGPLGAGIGTLVGSVAGLLGANKARKAAIENSNNYATNVNKTFSDQYAMGGLIDPPTDNEPWQTKKIVKYQPGVTSGKNGDSGFYLYSKDNTDPTFNYKTDREFVKNSAMNNLQKTAQWQDYMRNKTVNIKPNVDLNLTNPITEEYAYGGKMKKYADGGYYENLVLRNDNTDPNYSREDLTNAKRLSILDQTGLKPMGTTVPYTIGTQPSVNIANVNKTLASGPSSFDMLKFNAGKIGDYVNKNAGNIARYAPIAANALQLAQLKKPQGERLDRLSNRYKPEYVDEAALQNIADNTMNNSVNAISQSGASQGQQRSSIIGSQLQRTKALSDAYNQAAAQNRTVNDRAQTFNLGVDQVNLNQSNTEKDINAKDQAAYRNEKSKYISAIGSDIGDIGKEQAQKKMISTATGYTYDGKYVRSPDGNIVTDPDTGEPITGDKLKESKSSKNVKKQALGGYLIKNKLK